MFWNVLTKIIPWYLTAEQLFTRYILKNSETAPNAIALYIYTQLINEFIKNSSLGNRSLQGSDKLIKGAENDSVSLFEMHRQMAGRNITVTMLRFLLKNNAVNCFMRMLTHFPKKVYKCLSAEEWLFTVCRNCPPETAIPIIQRIEQDNPGIVAGTRDPWGNTLLWNTCANHHFRVNEIQKFLIDLGCDPAAENRLGLSFRLIQKNKLENDN